MTKSDVPAKYTDLPGWFLRRFGAGSDNGLATPSRQTSRESFDVGQKFMRMKWPHLLLIHLGLWNLCPAETTNEKSMETTITAGIHVITLGVSDLERSFLFYKDGLGLPTKMNPDGGIVLFTTSGARLFLYPYSKLAEDAGLPPDDHETQKKGFPGFTLGHAVRTRGEVDELLSAAEKAGGSIVKAAEDVSWGGYSGYFSDPDGYLWEIAHFDKWTFTSDGSLNLE